LFAFVVLQFTPRGKKKKMLFRVVAGTSDYQQHRGSMLTGNMEIGNDSLVAARFSSVR